MKTIYRDSSLQTNMQHGAASMKSAYPAVVALPVHHGTGSVLPTTILNELSAPPPGIIFVLYCPPPSLMNYLHPLQV